MYSKKILKKMYILYFNKELNKRDVATIIKKRYKINKSIENICREMSFIFPHRKRKSDFSEKERTFLLYMYKKCSNTEKLANYINSKSIIKNKITVSKLSSLASDYGIAKIAKKIPTTSFTSKQDRLNIVKLYNEGLTSNEIMKIYNFKTSKSILDILKAENVKIRHGSNSYTSRKIFNFKSLDSEFKAYYLGILLTDGYISNNRTNVSVQMADKDVIDFINKNTSGNMIEINRKDSNRKTMYRTSIYHSDYKSQLERLGITSNKSLTLQGPKLYDNEKQYIPYILRGIIDGDGWIRKDGKEFFICSASKDFILWCKEALESLGMKKLKIKFIDNKYNGIYNLRSARNENIQILKNIYKIPFGMNRKFSLLHKDVQRL